MRFFIMFISCMLFVAVSSSGQYADQSVINAPVPPTPNAASLLKFVDFPISYFTGTAEISLPIYEIKGKGLSLPISLTFSPNGLKVDEIASWVGYGWSLNATGLVGRTILDIPDEWGHGYFSTEARQYFRADGSVLKDSCSHPPVDPNDYFNFFLNTSAFYNRTNRALGQSANGENYIDTEPDIFSFTTPSGVSGKFVMDLDKNIRMIPKKPVRIDMFGTDINDKSFNISDENGIQYWFNTAKERVNSTTVCSNLTGSSRYGSDPISSWFISSMSSIKTNEGISFSYLPEITTYSTSSASTSFLISSTGVGAQGNDLDFTCNTQNTVYGVRLSSIYFNNLRVDFLADQAQRSDLQGGHRLKQISVIQNVSDTLKKFIFYHSYSSTYLRLDSVVEYGTNGRRLPAHKFFYEEVQSQRGSFDQDHWGYYNGAGNTTLLPKYQVASPSIQINFKGANRETNTQMAKQGSLHTVIHPTGGYTKYEYESNTISSPEILVFDRISHANLISPLEGGMHVDYQDFTLQESTYVEVVDIQSWMGPNGEISAYCGAEIFGVGNSYHQGILDNSDGSFLLIPPGDYRLKTYVATNFSPVTDVYLSIRWQKVLSNLINKPIGGLRIKSIKKYNGLTGQPVLIRDLDYNYADGLSTARLFIDNYYWHDISFSEAYPAGIFGNCTNLGAGATFRVLKSSSLIQPALIQGSPVGYSVVTEYQDSGVSGKTVYTYHNNTDFNTLHLYPQVTNVMNTYKQSFLVAKEEYNGAGVKLKETRNYPKFGSVQESHKIYGFQVVNTPITVCPSCDFIFSDYYHLSQPMAIDSMVEINYANGVALKRLTFYQYDLASIYGGDSYFLLRRSIIKDSQNKTRVTENKYAYDFRSVNPEMNKLYLINEQTPVMQTVRDNSNNVWNSRITNYVNYKPINYFDLESTTSVNYSLLSSITNLTNPGNGFVEKANYNYSATGDLISINKKNDLTQAFVWDSSNPILLIAEARNATPDQIFFNGFESLTNPNTILGGARTGNRALNAGIYNFAIDGLFAPAVTTNLKMSYWYWMNSKWNFSGIVNFNNLISIGSLLDDIRVFPSNAIMTTYTYDAGVGITSVTDHNNQTSFYKYDDLGRLKYILDAKQNVLKKIDYHYMKE
jgi:hypothetical protein